MNEWIKYFGLQTLLWSRKLFFRRPGVAYIISSWFFPTDLLLWILLYRRRILSSWFRNRSACYIFSILEREYRNHRSVSSVWMFVFKHIFLCLKRMLVHTHNVVFKLMALNKTVVTPMHLHWSHHSLGLSFEMIESFAQLDCPGVAVAYDMYILMG